jgi:hypothetical protein
MRQLPRECRRAEAEAGVDEVEGDQLPLARPDVLC